MVVRLSMGVGNYDRIQPLRTGEVSVNGVELELVARPPRKLFPELVKHQNFDVAELSLALYTNWTAEDDCPYVGLPAFPSRFFRHGNLFINDEAEITSPEDLRDGRIGIAAEYQITAATFIRGMLEDEYDLAPDEVTWYTTRADSLPLADPDGITKHAVRPEDGTKELDARARLIGMLANGELDAIIATNVRPLLEDGIKRLFPDFKQTEMDYYERTGIFPIMHLMVVREEIYETMPWVVRPLYEAMVEAKDMALDRLYFRGALPVALPWLIEHIEETKQFLGEDYWPYGYESNRLTLDAFTRYVHEQGISSRRVEPEELFVEELLKT